MMTMKFTLVVTVLAIVCFAGSATAQRDSTQAAMEQIERILSGTRKPRTRAGLVQHLARELSKNCDNPSSKIVQLISDAQDISVKKRRPLRFLRTYAEIAQLSTCKEFGSTASSGRRLQSSSKLGDVCTKVVMGSGYNGSFVEEIECGMAAAAAGTACSDVLEGGDGAAYVKCIRALIDGCPCSCVQSLIGFPSSYCQYWP